MKRAVRNAQKRKIPEFAGPAGRLGTEGRSPESLCSMAARRLCITSVPVSGALVLDRSGERLGKRAGRIANGEG